MTLEQVIVLPCSGESLEAASHDSEPNPPDSHTTSFSAPDARLGGLFRARLAPRDATADSLLDASRSGGQLSPSTAPTSALTPDRSSACYPAYTPDTFLNSPAFDTPQSGDPWALEVVQYDPTADYTADSAQLSRKRKRGGPGGSTARNRAVSRRTDPLTTDKTPKRVVYTDASGAVVGIMTVFGLSQVLREPPDRQSKLATTLTKHLGACKKCSKLRSRCNQSQSPYVPCEQCMRLVQNAWYHRDSKLIFSPCLQVDLPGLRLHRKGPIIRNDLQLWVQRKRYLMGHEILDSRQTLYLTQGFGEGMADALELTVSRFDPSYGDFTAYHYTDEYGQARSVEMPPYFISDLDEALENLKEFVFNTRSVYVENVHAESDPLIRQTFQAVLQFTSFTNNELVSTALDVWVASRLIEKHWHVFLGGLDIVTPMMDQQLDDMIIRHLIEPLMLDLLHMVEAKINEQKKENWYELYLAIFIVMSNVGLIIKDMGIQARWKGLLTGRRGGSLTRGFMHACKTLLAFFHFGCAGAVPFTLPFDEPGAKLKAIHGMTPEQVEYIRYVRNLVSSQEKIARWKDLSMYDDDGYWCYQMLCSDWDGSIPYAGEIDDYREEDFMSSSTT